MYGAHVSRLGAILCRRSTHNRVVDAAYAVARAGELRAADHRVYVYPLGGSSPIGCVAYAACAAEIVQQSQTHALRFDCIVVPNGSGRTHAGLVAGFAALGTGTIEVDAYTVYAPAADAYRTTLDNAWQTARIINCDRDISPDAVRVDSSQLGQATGCRRTPSAEPSGCWPRKKGSCSILFIAARRLRG
ncbi:pyridoxal-phosphate dependent enzyme [Burkholderia pseudomultivorans]|nr:pyridoxal-phosphate dependent enzyme [Burkholderia pseudomultivorans]